MIEFDLLIHAPAGPIPKAPGGLSESDALMLSANKLTVSETKYVKSFVYASIKRPATR